jgi:hypothetical protein
MGLLRANDDEAPNGPPAEAAMPYSRGQKALLGAVVVVGLLIMIGVGVVIFTIVNRLGKLPDTQKSPPEATAALTMPAEATLALPAGAEVEEMALDGARLALRYKSPSGAGIVLYDLSAGTSLGTVRLGP